MLFTFENGVPLVRWGASVVWRRQLLLMNDFNGAGAAVFSCRFCFLGAFPFVSLILLTTAGVQCLCGGCKKSPRTTSLCSHIVHHCVVILFWSSGIMECTCMLFTFENGVPLVRWRASVVWRRQLLLMNDFNGAGAAVFSCRLCFMGAFPFVSFLLLLCKNTGTHAHSIIASTLIQYNISSYFAMEQATVAKSFGQQSLQVTVLLTVCVALIFYLSVIILYVCW